MPAKSTASAGLYKIRGQIMTKYDLGIIGAGPGGYTAALAAAEQGKNVVLFEKENIGGVCLNKGCIPTKSILHSSELYKKLQNAQDFGINVTGAEVDFQKVIERKNKNIETLRKGIELALKNAKVTTIAKEAKILTPTTIEAAGEIYQADKIICAAGSSPRNLKGLEFDHKFILSSDDILNLDKLPKRILIVGSGAIGLEWARIFSNFGVEVTLTELAPNLLPLADIEVSKRVERCFKKEKIKFYTGTSVIRVEDCKVTLSNNEILMPEKILVAAGRVSNCGKKIDGITYIGDAAGEIQLAHYAVKQAYNVCAGIDYCKNLIPSVIYGTPEIAWAGMREQDLEAGTYQKSVQLVSALGKAWCDGETEGFIKILSQNDKIIGVHIVCTEASSLLTAMLFAMQNNITVDALKQVCFAHPTYSEGLFEALLKLK